MISITADIDISFKPVDPSLYSEKKLYEQIASCLLENSITSGYVLGCLGEHEEFSLFKSGDYWIVGFSERGNHYAKGIFMDFASATDFFFSIMLGSNAKYWKWIDVFEEK